MLIVPTWRGGGVDDPSPRRPSPIFNIHPLRDDHSKVRHASVFLLEPMGRGGVTMELELQGKRGVFEANGRFGGGTLCFPTPLTVEGEDPLYFGEVITGRQWRSCVHLGDVLRRRY
jgi:hypothetical protein